VMAEEKGGWEGDRGGVHDLAEAKPAMVKKWDGGIEEIIRGCLEGIGKLADEISIYGYKYIRPFLVS
jgi:hypothetical protein